MESKKQRDEKEDKKEENKEDKLEEISQQVQKGIDIEKGPLLNVAIFKIGKLGMFSAQEISLRPGKYVAVGNRAGYRDVRIEFRVAPEDDMQPVVIQCEEQI